MATDTFTIKKNESRPTEETPNMASVDQKEKKNALEFFVIYKIKQKQKTSIISYIYVPAGTKPPGRVSSTVRLRLAPLQPQKKQISVSQPPRAM